MPVNICYYVIMKNYMDSHIKPIRLDGLPEDLRLALKKVRIQRGWTQAELGKRIGLPQTHISGIETGKVVPRFDTLLDLIRALGRDLLLVPRELVPAVQALIRDYQRNEGETHEDGERPLYAKEDGSGYGYGEYGEGFEDGSGFGGGNYDR